METLTITATMENNELYLYFINGRKLQREFITYEGIKYRVVLGEDIIALIKHKSYISNKKRQLRFLQKQKLLTHEQNINPDYINE